MNIKNENAKKEWIIELILESEEEWHGVDMIPGMSNVGDRANMHYGSRMTFSTNVLCFMNE